MSFSATRPLFKISPSNREWLSRQFNDPYVRARTSAKYRSRSAFKLLELEEKWKFLNADVMTIVDLGAAPGGWSQVAAAKLGWTEEEVFGLPRNVTRKGRAEVVADNPRFGLKTKSKGWSIVWEKEGDTDPLALLDDLETDKRTSWRVGRGTVIAVDLLPIIPSIPGVQTVTMDFLTPQAHSTIHSLLQNQPSSGGKADVILSDMAANASGNKTHDIETALEICTAVFKFALHHLRTADELGRRKGGVLVMKYFEHPLMSKFRHLYLKPHFSAVFNSKPDASRAGSSEGYWVCMGFTGRRAYGKKSEVPDDLELPGGSVVPSDGHDDSCWDQDLDENGHPLTIGH